MSQPRAIISTLYTSDSSEGEEDLEKKTSNLIKKLRLKPRQNESLYSQTFMDRERNVIKEMREYTKNKISSKASELYNKREDR